MATASRPMTRLVSHGFELRSNSPLQWTQTLKGGQGSKVLFRLVPFAKEAWVH